MLQWSFFFHIISSRVACFARVVPAPPRVLSSPRKLGDSAEEGGGFWCKRVVLQHQQGSTTPRLKGGNGQSRGDELVKGNELE